jgi:exopolysaccharide biosynthesis polyprenyl glycosylphosphotransferase
MAQNAVRSEAPRGQRVQHRSLPLASYDVRMRRELAHRRLIRSATRRTLRIATLHLLDALVLLGAAWLVCGALGADEAGRGMVPALTGILLIGLNARSAYHAGNARREGYRIVTGIMLGGAVIALLRAARLDLHLSNEALIAFVVSASLVVVAERKLVDAVVRQAYARGIGLRQAVIVTDASSATRVLRQLRGEHNRDQHIVGFLTPTPRPRAGAADAAPGSWLGSLRDLERVLERHRVEEVVVAAALPDEALHDLSSRCFERGVRVLVIPWASQLIGGRAEPVQLGSFPAYHLHPTRLEFPAMLLKRTADVAITGIILIATAPLMFAVAAAIKFDSRGPAFFRQRRVGLGGREFMMWKFRSMAHEAEARQEDVAHLNAYRDARLFKAASDPRVTRVGRFLRRYSLDELPQLFNVVAGDMSLVGPRPPLPTEVRRYEARHYVRLSVVPGMTGPWQVSGRSLITDFEEVVRLERAYVESWSLALDAQIMVKTFGVVFSGKGAY